MPFLGSIINLLLTFNNFIQLKQDIKMSTLPKNDYKVERLDDIPLLLEQLKRMGIASLIDENFEVHGNWQGLSLGWTVTVWLTHILSQADHCLCHGRP